jgi:hypothetical protein
MPDIKATGLRTALRRCDLDAELPHLAESVHHPPNAALRPVPHGINAGREAKPAATTPSTPTLPSPLEKKSPSRRRATTSTHALLLMYFYPMGLTSIRNLSSRAGAGGIERV